MQHTGSSRKVIILAPLQEIYQCFAIARTLARVSVPSLSSVQDSTPSINYVLKLCSCCASSKMDDL